jgi:hypothetical protein
MTANEAEAPAAANARHRLGLMNSMAVNCPGTTSNDSTWKQPTTRRDAAYPTHQRRSLRVRPRKSKKVEMETPATTKA